jgi:fumarate reductase subunit D
MARSNKPIIWALFAAGGTFAAFFTPVMILVTGLAVTFGLLPAEALAFERVLAVVQNPIGKGLMFLAVFLPAWHAAHRLRITAHGFGIRADTAVLAVCYGLAAVATLVTIFALFRV